MDTQVRRVAPSTGRAIALFSIIGAFFGGLFILLGPVLARSDHDYLTASILVAIGLTVLTVSAVMIWRLLWYRRNGGVLVDGDVITWIGLTGRPVKSCRKSSVAAIGVAIGSYVTWVTPDVSLEAAVLGEQLTKGWDENIMYLIRPGSDDIAIPMRMFRVGDAERLAGILGVPFLKRPKRTDET